MAQEKIAIFFEPLSGSLFYHETLVYTDSTGAQYFSVAYPSNDMPKGFVGDLIAQSQYAVATGTNSIYGHLTTEQNVPVSSSSGSTLVHWFGPPNAPYHSEIVDVGNDLSQEWQKICQAYSLIGAENLPYGVLTQNSNTVVGSALAFADIPLPTDTDIYAVYDASVDQTGNKVSYWAPGGTNLLSVPPTITFTHPLSGSDISSALMDASGNEITTVSGYGSTGAPNKQITFTSMPNGNTRDGSITIFDPTGLPLTTIYVDSKTGIVNKFVTGSGSNLLLDPSDNVTGFESIGTQLKAVLSDDLNGNPVSVMIDPSGSYSLGLDPPTFEPVIDVPAGGLNGDMVSISISGQLATFNIQIGPGRTAEVSQDHAVAQVLDTYTFVSNDSTLKLDDPSSFLGTIYGFVLGDSIDLAGIGTAVSAAPDAGNALIVQEASGGTITLRLDSSQSFAGLTFTTAPDGYGGTEVTLSTPSMVSGTQSVTATGSINEPSSGDPYSADVNFSPTNIQFPARRTDDPLPKPVQISAAFTGGNLDPNSSADVVINQIYPNPSTFYLVSGFNVGPLNTSGTGQIVWQPSAAGDYINQTLPLDVSYEGGSTELDLRVSTKVYAPAAPQFEIGGVPTFALDYGTLHLGETVSRSIAIANVATGNLVDDLSSTPGTLGQFTAENGFSNIPAGSSATVTVDMTGEIPGPTLVLGSAPLFGLTGHDSDLPDEAVGQQSFLALSGTVNYYANPIFSNSVIGTAVGTLTQSGNSWTLDLGTVALGSYGADATVEIVNAAPSPFYSDALTGTAEVSTPPDGGFIQAINDLTGQTAFGNGGFLALGVFQPYGDVLGTHSETITFHAVSSNNSGFSGALPDETITIIDEVVQAPCYAAGTHISTPDGDMVVEELAVGDTVFAQFAGYTTIKWIGHRHVHCSRHPKPERVWPVRVQAGAFHDGVPYRDLWLSPDHAVFVDGVLIPVRLLINGTTIMQQAVERVTYFHVELPRHDVLLAEGLPAESYLDTGNRAMFADAGVAMMLHPDFATVNAGLKCWEHDACAPLATRATQVEPIWKKLAGRARTLGRPALRPSITTHPRLRLEACGRQLQPLAGRDGWHVFVLPPGTNAVRLVSNAGAPSDVRPWLEDRRRLGVSVRRIRARAGTELVDIPVDDPALKTGWHGVERQGEQLWRWTDGSACLQVPSGTRILEIQLTGSAEYRAEASSDEFVGPPCRRSATAAR